MPTTRALFCLVGAALLGAGLPAAVLHANLRAADAYQRLAQDVPSQLLLVALAIITGLCLTLGAGTSRNATLLGVLILIVAGVTLAVLNPLALSFPTYACWGLSLGSLGGQLLARRFHPRPSAGHNGRHES